jgi:hypothetical protein
MISGSGLNYIPQQTINLLATIELRFLPSLYHTDALPG